jgi:2'-5' RNA ligase
MSQRLFIAVDIPEEWQDKLVFTQKQLMELIPDIKLTHSKNFHLTICFIGDTPETELSELENKIDEIIKNFYGKIIIKPGELGSFYQRGRTIFWFGVEADSLALLAGRLQQFAQEREKRQIFKGHITLGRSNKRITEKINKGPGILSSYKPQEIVLYESIITKDGPLYKKIRSWELK